MGRFHFVVETKKVEWNGYYLIQLTTFLCMVRLPPRVSCSYLQQHIIEI
jgi:hypothetical protein